MDSMFYITCISKEAIESIMEYSYLNYRQCNKSNNYFSLDFVTLKISQILHTLMQLQTRIISMWNQESLAFPSLEILRNLFIGSPL